MALHGEYWTRFSAWVKIGEIYKKFRLIVYTDTQEYSWNDCFGEENNKRVCFEQIYDEGYRYACDISMSPGDRCIYFGRREVTLLEIEDYRESAVKATAISDDGEIKTCIINFEDYISYTLTSMKLFHHPQAESIMRKNHVNI